MVRSPRWTVGSSLGKAILYVLPWNVFGGAKALSILSPDFRFCILAAAFADFEDGEEGFLGDVDATDALHALLAFLLLLEEFAFAGDVAAVALGEDVFAHGVDRFASDDLGADRGLNGDFEHLAGDQFAHLRDKRFATFVGEVAMHDDGEGVDGIAGNEDVELDHGR